MLHQRLGHPFAIKFQHVLKHLNVPVSHKCTQSLCTHCCTAKSHRLPFKLSTSSVNEPLALIHSDVWGPFVAANTSFRYYVLFVDD